MKHYSKMKVYFCPKLSFFGWAEEDWGVKDATVKQYEIRQFLLQNVTISKVEFLDK